MILRVVTGLMLIGHGGIGAETVRSRSLIAVVGWCEIALGLLLLAWPARGLLLFAFAWKVGTELLRPLAGEPIWQFMERSGAYAAPLALAVILTWQRWGRRAISTDPPISGLAA